MDDNSQTLVEVNDLSKTFGNVAALYNVKFSISKGQIWGIVGQRGAGKSTLFQILAGLTQPTTGEIRWEGNRIAIQNPAHAHELGIEFVPQSPILVENFNILNNVFLGREIAHFPPLKVWPKEGQMLHAVREFLEEFDLSGDMAFQMPRELSNEQRQIVALARVFINPAKILLLDDPLASLSFERQQKLLSKIKNVSLQNVSVLLSSDDLNHIFAVTDHILVLYQGTQVAVKKTAETTPREIVELIVGSNRRERVTPVIWAFENYYEAQKKAEELKRTQTYLEKSLKEQDNLNRQLIERLGNQLKALDRLNLALQEANRRLMTEREAERKALARDLHDQVIQDLLSFNYQLEAVESEHQDENLCRDLSKIREGIRQVIGSLRQLCSDLRPPTIDSHGLPSAIRSFAHQWSEKTGIEVDLDIDDGLGRLPETIELSVFRIIQEGLSNVRKHAQATKVKITLFRTATASLVVQIKDNGKGSQQPINLEKLSEEKHFGLIGISERVSLLGGHMKVNAQSKSGLELYIEIPSPYPMYTS